MYWFLWTKFTCFRQLKTKWNEIYSVVSLYEMKIQCTKYVIIIKSPQKSSNRHNNHQIATIIITTRHFRNFVAIWRLLNISSSISGFRLCQLLALWPFVRTPELSKRCKVPTEIVKENKNTQTCVISVFSRFR